jgi:hypothetical protein
LAAVEEGGDHPILKFNHRKRLVAVTPEINAMSGGIAHKRIQSIFNPSSFFGGIQADTCAQTIKHTSR